MISRKSGKAKGAAIKRSGGSNPNNTITVGNVTYRGGGKKKGDGSGKKYKRKRKKRT